MSKRTRRRRNQPETRHRRTHGRLVVAALLVALTASGVAVTRWGEWRAPPGLSHSTAPAQVSPSPPSLSKEYVYAGGRLVATEDPAAPSTPAGHAPSNLVATAASSAQVQLTWAPPEGTPPAQYVVERTATMSWENAPTITVPGTNTTHTDTPPAGGGIVAYLYRVRAVSAAGAQSGPSNIDLTTTVVFTGDDQITPGAIIRASQLVKLRRAVNAVRALAGLPPAAWTYPDPSPVPGQRRTIYLEDVAELRSGIDPALNLLGRYLNYPAAPTLARGAAIYAEHFNQIRVRAE